MPTFDYSRKKTTSSNHSSGLTSHLAQRKTPTPHLIPPTQSESSEKTSIQPRNDRDENGNPAWWSRLNWNPQPAGVQAKLTVGEPNDQYEQEADQVASKVVNQISAPQPSPVQREEKPEDEIQTKPLAASITPLVQREEKAEEELQTMPVQRVAEVGETDASPDVESSIEQARGGGQPLDQTIRAPMEQAMGADFSGVKIHTDAQADQLNRSLLSKAFTTKQDVFFRQGEYNPGSRGGQELLAHELTHVVQQNGRHFSQVDPKIQKNVDLDRVKATFNAQQRSHPHPGKENLIGTIKKLIESFSDPESDLSHIAVIREYMDIVLSTFTDGLVAIGLPESNSKLKKVINLKRQITEARLICEGIYRRCLISSGDEQASSLKAEASEYLGNAWELVYAAKEEVLNKLNATAKTGAREARRWGSEARGNLVEDDSIDIRSTKLAQVVKENGFIPHIVVGLPTAGAHIAARVAGTLNVSSTDSSATTKLMTFRPRYVKPSADTSSRTQDNIDADNKRGLEREIKVVLPHRENTTEKLVVRVLIVDDFSKSGGSLMQAAQKISETLVTLKYTPEVKTAVTRYTSAQLRDELISDEGSLKNPVDYVVGVHGSGERTAMREKMLDAEGLYPRDELMDQAEDWEKGWTQSGLEAMHMTENTSPSFITRLKNLVGLIL